MARGNRTRPRHRQLPVHAGMYGLQEHGTENATTIADHARVTDRGPRILVSPAKLRPAADRPVIGLRRGQCSGDETLVFGILRTDKTCEGEALRKVQGIDRIKTVYTGFSAGIEGNPLEAISDASPISGKKLMEPEGRPSRCLRVRQLRLPGNVAETGIKERPAAADKIVQSKMVVRFDGRAIGFLVRQGRNETCVRTSRSRDNISAIAAIKKTGGNGKILGYVQTQMGRQPVLRIEVQILRSLILTRELLIHRQAARVSEGPAHARGCFGNLDIWKNRFAGIAFHPARNQQWIVIVGGAHIDSAAQIVRAFHFR